MVAQVYQLDALGDRHLLDDSVDRVLASPRVHVGLHRLLRGPIREVDGAPVGTVHTHSVGDQDAHECQKNDYE